MGRFLSAVLKSLLLMMRVVSSNVLLLQRVSLPSILILATVGSISCVLTVSQESRAVHWVRCSTRALETVLMDSVLILKQFLSALLIMLLLMAHDLRNRRLATSMLQTNKF